MLFGTDRSFFPPLKGTGRWKSVTEDLAVINGVAVEDGEKKAVCGGTYFRPCVDATYMRNVKPNDSLRRCTTRIKADIGGIDVGYI